MAQSAKRPTSAQAMISRSVSSSPTSGSVLTAQSLEPAWDSVSPSLSPPPLFVLCLLKKKNKKTTCPNSCCKRNISGEYMNFDLECYFCVG